jgi:hypothetical protein
MNSFLKRKWLFIPYICLAILVVGGSILWFMGKNKADDILNLAFNAEHKKGVEITCDNRSIGGYPLKYSVTCEKLLLKSQGTSVIIPKAQAVIQVWNKNHVIAELNTPITFNDPSIFTIAGDPLLLSVVSENKDDFRFALTHNNGKLGDKGHFTYGNSEIHATKTIEGSDERGKFNLAVNNIVATSDDASAQKLFTLLKTFTMSGETLLSPRLAPKPDKDELLRWFKAGGKITFNDFTFTINEIKMQNTGQFQLDKDGLLNGNLSVTFSNIEPVLEQAKTQPSVNQSLQGALIFAKKETVNGKTTYKYEFTAEKGQINMQGLPVYKLPAIN